MSSQEYDNGAPVLSRTVLNAVRGWSLQGTEGEDYDETVSRYQRYIFRKWLFMAACIIVIVCVAGYAVTIGAYDIKFLESYQIIWDHIWGNVDPNDEVAVTKDYIVVTLRMPRIAVGIIAGAGLAVAGVVMQSTLLNPLADPYTTGISSGASFGATIAMTMGVTVATGQYAIVLNAFIFSLVPMFVIMAVAKIKSSSPTVMIMAGIAVMYIFNACTTVMMLWANPNDLQAVYEWQVGSVSRVTWDQVPIMFVVVLIGIIVMQLLSKKLNVLATGEDSANALGVNATQLRMINLLVVSLVSASIVSFTGLIGFVGLVSPHIARIFIGSDNRYLIPCSAVLGSALIVGADLVGRVIVAPATLQVGVVMAFLGGPMFLWLIMRKKSQVWA